MFFEIHHELHYRYGRPVFLEPHTLRLTPRQDATQRVLSHTLQLTDPASGCSEVLEPGGGDATVCWFSDLRERLSIVSTAVVETLRDNPFDWILTEPGAQTLPITYAPVHAEALAPFLASGPADPGVAAWAAELAGEVEHSTTDFLMHLADRIHHTFHHVGRLDGEPMAAMETLAQRQGACRDTAVLYVEACRSLGLAARFVSGYSMHHPPEVSEHELHAWAEVWLPGGGWRGYDPSLGLAVADGHVVLAATADHRLAAAVSGHYRGTGVSSEFSYTTRIRASPTQPVHRRGAALLADPLQNRDTAFSPEERRALQLEALLPAAVETLAMQVQRVWEGFCRLQGNLERFTYLSGLRRSNLTLFHAFLRQHVEVALPVVYTPTVGAVIEGFSHAHQPPDLGLYLTPEHQDRLPGLLRLAAAGPVELLLVTDGEGILGLGDQGVGGIHICQGKLAVYTLCSGLHPARALAVTLDVGTNRSSLLDDPLYPGLRRPRLSGEAYDAFVDAFIAAVREVFPGAFLHWEDLGNRQARRQLDRHRHHLPSFNDDIQGTSGVAAAAVLAACQGLGQSLTDQRIVIFGAGTAGCGIADRLLRLLQAGGLDPAEARARLWAIDRGGLLIEDQPGIPAAARPFVRPAAERDLFGSPSGDGIGLLEVVRQVKPTVLIGTSTVAGAFSREVVEAMADATARPVILPLSNPTSLAEATPTDLLEWTGGRAMVATGSPFAPVAWGGESRVIGQCNNCFLYPGLGFACVAVGASLVSEAMIDAALLALARTIPAASDPDRPLMPPLREVRAVSRAVAEAVATTAVDQGLARLAGSHAEALACLDQATWEPDYRAPA